MTEPSCPACAVLSGHRHGHKNGACRFCRGVVGAMEANVPDYFEAMADDLIYDAIELYERSGKGTFALEMTVRGCVYAPAFVEGNYDEVFQRLDALGRMPYAEYLRTPEWAEHRRRALIRAGGHCQGCGTADNLETHHRSYEHRGHEEPEDLIVLCAACHTAVHLVADGRRNKVRAQGRRARV